MRGFANEVVGEGFSIRLPLPRVLERNRKYGTPWSRREGGRQQGVFG